jgi:uncharacterized membrane protein YphA (DoxX/SURF4 family)
MELIRLDPILGWILRASLAALFATAAIHKIRDPRAFLRTFSDYELLPRMLIAPGAIVLVTMELAVAIGLLLDERGSGAGLAALSLLLVYSLAIVVNLLRGRREIDCGCLGPAIHQPLSAWLVLRNLLLAIGAGAASLPVSDRSLHLLDGVSLLGGLMTLALLFHAIDNLAAQTWFWPEREKAS